MHTVVVQSSGLCQICEFRITACDNLLDSSISCYYLISGLAGSQNDRLGPIQPAEHGLAYWPVRAYTHLGTSVTAAVCPRISLPQASGWAVAPYLPQPKLESSPSVHKPPMVEFLVAYEGLM